MIKHLESKKHDRERVHIKRTEAWTDSIRGDWTGTVLLLSGMASFGSLFSHGAPATCLADLIFIIIPTQMKTVHTQSSGPYLFLLRKYMRSETNQRKLTAKP